MSLALYRLAQGVSYRASGVSLTTPRSEVTDETNILRSNAERQVQAQGSLSLCLKAKPWVGEKAMLMACACNPSTGVREDIHKVP